MPWTAVRIDGGEPLPFGLNLSRNIWHCHPSVMLGDRYKVGKAAVRTFRLETADLGPLRDRGVDCEISPAAFEGLPVAGLVGLTRYEPFLLDWDRLTWTVGADRPEDWKSLPIPQTSRGGPMVDAIVDGRRARLAVLSFFPWGLQLNHRFVRSNRLWNSFARRRDNHSAGGVPTFRTVVVGKLQLGDLAFDDVITRMHNRPASYRHVNADDVDGVIGFDLIRRMNIYFNRSRVSVVSPQDRERVIDARPPPTVRASYSRARQEPYADDRAGFVPRDIGGALEIAWIDPTGPAGKAGLRVGDVIEDFEGDSGILGLPHAVTQPAGTELRIETSRNGKRTWRTLVLEDRV
ncbi:MAG TPA: hypothetical protein VEA44_00535 [Caulobacter sp.]|nr:hypothetical protein [Caulobacter sp.]